MRSLKVIVFITTRFKLVLVRKREGEIICQVGNTLLIAKKQVVFFSQWNVDLQEISIRNINLIFQNLH